MKKLLTLVGLGAVAYWLVKDRLSVNDDEFAFTEVPSDEEQAASGPEPA